MRQDFFEYTPQFKLVIAGNHKPAIRNVDEAMKRRLAHAGLTIAWEAGADGDEERWHWTLAQR